jgi:hypothetical protein
MQMDKYLKRLCAFQRILNCNLRIYEHIWYENYEFYVTKNKSKVRLHLVILKSCPMSPPVYFLHLSFIKMSISCTCLLKSIVSVIKYFDAIDQRESKVNLHKATSSPESPSNVSPAIKLVYICLFLEKKNRKIFCSPSFRPKWH